MFSVRHITNNVKRFFPIVRPLGSKAGPLTELKVDNDGIAILTMQRMPVNSLNLDMLQDLSKSFDEIEKNKAKAMIITSASPTVFSAGLDIMELYNPDTERVETMWNVLVDVWMKLFGSPYISAAAINGHAPAGGCLLSMSCEYRTMVSGKFTIGLNETALGIIVPPWFMDTLCHAIPPRQVELALTLGKLFSVEEALKMGFIDETASDKDNAIDKCKAFIKTFDRISPMARSVTKRLLRQNILKKLQENRKQDTQIFLQYILNPKVQKCLEMYIQTMKRKPLLE